MNLLLAALVDTDLYVQPTIVKQGWWSGKQLQWWQSHGVRRGQLSLQR